jgi:hypothetical protein
MSSPATVRVVFASPPTALDVSVTCVEDNDSGPIILDMRDPAGLPTSATLVTLPSYGSLSALDSSNNVAGTFDSTTELPVSTTLRLVYHPDADNARTDSFTYTATNTQGLTSEPGRVEVAMYTINDEPQVDDPSATVDDANAEVAIGIEVVDTDDTFVSVFVNELPATGTLYYSGDDMTKPVEAYQPSFAGRIDQYVQAREQRMRASEGCARAKEARERRRRASEGGARAKEARERRRRTSEGGARAKEARERSERQKALLSLSVGFTRALLPLSVGFTRALLPLSVGFTRALASLAPKGVAASVRR